MHTTGTKPTESTFVFRSYANPDNTTTATKLKAVFYNKVKTGTLKITKTAAEGSDSTVWRVINSVLPFPMWVTWDWKKALLLWTILP